MGLWCVVLEFEAADLGHTSISLSLGLGVPAATAAVVSSSPPRSTPAAGGWILNQHNHRHPRPWKCWSTDAWDSSIKSTPSSKNQDGFHTIMELVRDKYKWSSRDEMGIAVRAERIRYRKEVEGPAFDALRERRAASGPSAAAVRKEPLASSCYSEEEEDYYRDMLDGTEPCLSQVADAPGVTSLSVKIAWPPSRPQCSYPASASVAGSHKSLLLLRLGACIPGSFDPGFYMVYNTRANSVALVPPIWPRFGVSSRWHCRIARGSGGGAVAVQCLGATSEHHDYILAELLLLRGDRSHLPTSKATLFTWKSLAVGGLPTEELGQWIPKEVEVELPLPCHQDDTSFRADMVFAVGHTSLCWVDLLTGILVYNHAAAGDEQSQFHFIPLHPKIHAMDITSQLQQGWPEEYCSMCCIDDDTLQFVSIEGFNQDNIPVAEMKLTTWTLRSPRSRTKWQWHLLPSVRIGDLCLDPHYNALPLLPRFPVISTRQPHVIYLSVHNYKYNSEYNLMEATENYVVSLDMRLRGVVSAFKSSSPGNGVAIHRSIFTSDFTSCMNQTRVDLRKERPRGEEKKVADVGGESRSNPAAWMKVWIFREESVVGGLGGRRVIPTPSTALRACSTFCPVVGLQCALDSTFPDSTEN